ncbi:SulP family inorganic anion transporter [Catellatospora coxensis]
MLSRWLAALTHAAVLAVIMLAAAPLVAHIPLAALAGVLLATAIRMVEVGSLLALARSTRSDAVLMALTAAATLALDLVAAVAIGLVVATFLAVRKIARAATLEQVPWTCPTTTPRRRPCCPSTSWRTGSTVRCSSPRPTGSCSN